MKPWKSFLLFAGMLTTGCAAEGEETNREVPPSAPDGVIIAGDQEHELSFVTSIWNVELPEGKQQTIQTGGTGLQAVADAPPAVEAERGQPVDVRFENGRTPDQIAGYWRRGEERDKGERLEDKTSLELPEKAGTYMYEMDTQWSGSGYEGEITYAVKVKVS